MLKNNALPRPFLLILGAVLAIRVAVGLVVQSPYILMDELIYAKLAWGFGHGEAMHFRGWPSDLPGGRPEGGMQDPLVFPSILYPLLIAPATLFDDMFLGFRLIQILNHAFVVSAAVPVYLLARMVVSPASALAVSLLAVLLPSTFLANLVMSENLFFPLMMWLVYLTVWSAGSARVFPKVWLGLALLLAFFTKPHGMVVPPVVVLVTFLASEWYRRGEAGFWRRFLSYWPAVGLFAAGGVTHVMVTNLRLGGDLFDLSRALGTYGGAMQAQRGLEVLASIKCLAGNFSALALAVGMVPAVLCGAWAWTALRKGTPEERRLLWCAASLGAAVLLLTVRLTVQLENTPDRIHERYAFYLEPLILLGAAAWLERGKLGLGWTVAFGSLALGLAAYFLQPVLGTPIAADTATYTAFWPLAKVAGPAAALAALLLLGLAMVWLSSLAIARETRRWAGALCAAWIVGLSTATVAAQAHQTAKFLPATRWLVSMAKPGERLALAGERDQFVPYMIFDLFYPGYIRKFHFTEPFDGWGDEAAPKTGDGEYPALSNLPDGTLLLSTGAHKLDLPVLGQMNDYELYRKTGRVFGRPNSAMRRAEPLVKR